MTVYSLQKKLEKIVTPPQDCRDRFFTFLKKLQKAQIHHFTQKSKRVPWHIEAMFVRNFLHYWTFQAVDFENLIRFSFGVRLGYQIEK